MRLVLDSNVLIAAFVARGFCSELFEHCSREHERVTSLFILDEVRRNLVGKIGIPAVDADAAVNLIRTRFEIVEPALLPRRVSRDADDDVILGTAVAGRCEVVVSGDRDLLEVKSYEAVRTVSPRDFWRTEARTR